MIFTDGARVQGDVGIHELSTSTGALLETTAAEAASEWPVRQLAGMRELAEAKGEREDLGSAIARVQAGEDPADVMARPATAPEIPVAEARERVKQAGFEKSLHLPEQGTIREPALNIMLDRARARRERETTISRGPSGIVPSALSIGTSFLVGAVDPLNIASAFIPVVGELRYAKLMADAGTSAFARAGVRATVGGAAGAVGSVPLTGIEALAHTEEGRDFTYADALRNVLFGTVLGAGLHSIGGAGADVLRRRKGKELFPFAPGEPFERPVAGEPLGTPQARETPGRPEGAPEGEFATPEALPQPAAAFEASPVVKALDDLPPRAKEDAMRAAIADLAEGRPVAAGELIEAAAKSDPRIAESLEIAEPSVVAGPKAARDPRARDPQTWSLNEFIASRGGLDPTDPLIGDLRGSIGTSNKFVPGFGHLIRERGMKLDEAREAAVEAGYLRDHGADAGRESTTDIRTLLDAFDRELRGERVYREGREPEAKGQHPDDYRAEIEREAVGALRDDGIDPQSVPDKTMARVVEIMEREGERDPLAAYERAVMEETHYGAETGQHQRIADEIPGWDLPDDAAAASRPGGAVAGAGERGAGAAARQSGNGDRAAAAEERLKDWQRLAERASEADDPDVLARSRAAEKLQEPASADPNKRQQAAENAAAIADQQYKDAEAYLPADLRERVEAELKALEQDAGDANEVIRRGAACLAAAVGAAA